MTKDNDIEGINHSVGECLFCGCLSFTSNVNLKDGYYNIRCTGCEMTGPVEISVSDAVNSWAKLKAQEAEIERLRGERDMAVRYLWAHTVHHKFEGCLSWIKGQYAKRAGKALNPNGEK